MKVNYSRESLPYTFTIVREADENHIAEADIDFDLSPEELARLRADWKEFRRQSTCEVCGKWSASEYNGHILCEHHRMQLFKALM